MEDWVKARDEHDVRMRTPAYREAFLAEQDRLKRVVEENKQILDMIQETGRVFDEGLAGSQAPVGFERLMQMTEAEKQVVADNFTETYNEIRKKMADDRAAKTRKLSSGEVAVRRQPHTASNRVRLIKYPQEIELNGWANGENLRGNSIWFRAAQGGWIWSGMFDNRSLDNLHPVTPPRIDPEQIRRSNVSALIAETYLPGVIRPQTFVGLDAPQARAKYAPPRALPPLSPEEMDVMVEKERNVQANMAYRVGPHPWFGWRLSVDRHDGRQQVFWRPTETSADRLGHKYLERAVMRRRRLWEAANPRLVTARDRWIVEPTQAEQTAKEQAEWDAEFHGKEEQ